MRLGVLTGGGDAPGTNAVIRALTQALAQGQGTEVLGIEDGFLGLMERRTTPLNWPLVHGLLGQGGTFLGSSNRATPLNHEGSDRRRQVLDYAQELGLDGLVVIGGDGTLSIAAAMHSFGLPCIGVPKTIDNDIYGVERSFGFDTAVARATEAIERVQTSAQSMRRVMLVETMGRNAGWIALESGLASGADIILLPEIDFDLQAVVKTCRTREAAQRFTMICVAEGAKPRGGQTVTRAWIEDSPEPQRLGGIAALLAQQLQPQLRSEVRAVTLGHVQRGGSPTATDRVLGTHYGTAAALLVRDNAWSEMVTWTHGRIGRAPLASVAGRSRPVASDEPLLQCARALAVSLGQD